jgi:hypothetical protein
MRITCFPPYPVLLVDKRPLRDQFRRSNIAMILLTEGAAQNRAVLTRSMFGAIYASAAVVRAVMASSKVGKIRNSGSTLVVSNSFNTRSLTPLNAMRRVALCRVT